MNIQHESGEATNLESVREKRTSKKQLKIKIIIFGCIVLLVGMVVIMLPRLNQYLASHENLLLDYAEIWPIHFRDDFNQDSLSYWTPTDNVMEPGIERLETKSGYFDITFAPTKDSIVRDAFFNKQAPASKNFLLTMQVTPPLSCHTGLIFRGTTRGDYYVFLVGNDSYTSEILPQNENMDFPREAILPNTPFPKGIEQPHTLNVLAYDNSYYFYINRIFVDKFSDKRLQGAQTGIELMVCNGVSTNSVFHIEEFTLRTPYILSLEK